jgi:hypothetical protein
MNEDFARFQEQLQESVKNAEKSVFDNILFVVERIGFKTDVTVYPRKSDTFKAG